jgi:hypothetical protein
MVEMVDTIETEGLELVVTRVQHAPCAAPHRPAPPRPR